MIRLQRDKMTAAIQRAKADRMHVRCTGERVYAVRSNSGNTYVVKFAVANGMKLAECCCKAGQAGMMCKHVAVAAAVNIAIATMKKRVADKAPSPAVAASTPAEASAETATLHIDGWAGHRAIPVEVIGETPKKVRIRATVETHLPGARVLQPGDVALVPKSAVTRQPETSATKREDLEREIEQRWSEKFGKRGYRLADSLMKFYGCNSMALMPVARLAEIKQAWF